MLRSHRIAVGFLAAILLLAPRVKAQSGPTIEQFLGPAYPFELMSAKKADRVAWIACERGSGTSTRLRLPISGLFV